MYTQVFELSGNVSLICVQVLMWVESKEKILGEMNARGWEEVRE